MLYCPDCELTFDESDIDDTQVDEEGTVWCHCGSELYSFDPEPHHPVYDTLEEKYL